jgi:serine phosphatase RsbU (regulator of sigma subunit)
MGSKNGTLLNGVRITSRSRLKHGDRLVVGQLGIVCVDLDAAPVPESVVFVPEVAEPHVGTNTVMTSLEGLLSGGPTGELTPPRGGSGDPNVYRHPVVVALLRAGRELADYRPLDELFRMILDLSIETARAERGVLMTLERGQLVTRAVHGEGFRISTTVRDRVLREKASVLVRDMGQDAALQQQLSIIGQQIHSLMAVPLQTLHEVIGLIYVDSRLFVREFTADDLNLLTVLANVAAIRILQEEEQTRKRDLEHASEIQTRLLPGEPPSVLGFDLAGHNAACRGVGGDYYDFLPRGEGRATLALGDVAGKGMPAALMMSSLQARVQVLIDDRQDLATLMSRLDRSIAVHCPMNRFITLFLCQIDSAGNELAYCNAGHNPGLVVRRDGEVRMLPATGTALGLLPERGYENRSEPFERGDLLALYSDGVTEALRGDEEFGVARLAELLVAHRDDPAREIVASINRALVDWGGPGPAEDDVTVLIARRV